jgi:hypothetical protein
MALKYDIVIRQGETFQRKIRWESAPILYKAISAISQTAPVQITAAGHGIPNGWRVAVVSVKGMTQINALGDPPKASDYHKASVISSSIIQLDSVNAAEYKAYTSGGYLQFNTPVNLTGFTARMTIRDKVGGTQLMSLTTQNGRLVISTSEHSISIVIDATDTAAQTWSRAVYDLEVEDSAGVVTAILYGTAKITKEVTSDA